MENDKIPLSVDALASIPINKHDNAITSIQKLAVFSGFKTLLIKTVLTTKANIAIEISQL